MSKVLNKNIGKWVSRLLDETDADELFKILVEQCNERQLKYLLDAAKEELTIHDKYVIECKTLDDKIKFETFAEIFRPHYNEQTLIF